MKTMKIEGTKYSPKIEFNPEGELILHGRSIMEDPIVFYKPVIEWIKNCQSEKFALEIQFEYMNTSSSKVLLDLMKTIKEKYNNNDLVINWYYDSDDEDMHEVGQDFESIISIPIYFHELCEDNA